MIIRTVALLLTLIVFMAGCTPASVATPNVLAATSEVEPLTETPTLIPPTEEPSPSPTPSPTPPAPTPSAAIIAPEIAIQAAALIPAASDDLAAAGAWDRYTIIAALNPNNLQVTGSVSLEFVNRYGVALDRIYFHLYPNHPDFGGSLRITNASVNGIGVPSGTQHGDTLFYLKLAEPLAANATAHVVLSFTATTPRNASDETFGAYNFEAGLWSMANFYPILARYFPDTGWDTRAVVSRGDFVVSSVALYDVTIDAPKGWTLIGTGVTINDEAVNADVHRQRFVSGPQREFYMGAFQNLQAAEAVVDGTRIVSYYQRGSSDGGQFGLAVAKQALRAYNARFGTYPLAELEVVQAALTQFLGMEYPGIVLIEQDLYHALDEDLEQTIAHEIAHQWWYSQVGNDAQGEPWLDEGLASYAQIVYYESLGDNEGARGELAFFRETFQRARAAGRDAPLGSSSAELGSGRYYPIIYAKAPLFFQALRNDIGATNFDTFIHTYYRTFRYQESSGPDILRIAQTSCACNLEQFYHDWVVTTAPVALP